MNQWPRFFPSPSLNDSDRKRGTFVWPHGQNVNDFPVSPQPWTIGFFIWSFIFSQVSTDINKSLGQLYIWGEDDQVSWCYYGRDSPVVETPYRGGYEVYYESITRELQRRLKHEYRCDERLKTKNEESTLLTDTGLVVERDFSYKLVYYETINRELKRRLTYEYRYDERLKKKKEKSTLLGDTEFVYY